MFQWNMFQRASAIVRHDVRVGQHARLAAPLFLRTTWLSPGVGSPVFKGSQVLRPWCIGHTSLSRWIIRRVLRNLTQRLYVACLGVSLRHSDRILAPSLLCPEGGVQ